VVRAGVQHDYEYLGVPDNRLKSNFAHTGEILLTADKLGCRNILCPSSYQVGHDTLTFASAVAPMTKQINLLTRGLSTTARSRTSPAARW
jgi:alkanesulfonate monooxygenase